jgi:FKBP-type peptidyl-prolyl cis-trans isomerase
MKVGGRRIMILPASLGYGAQASGSIPANSSLVFVVDLKSIDG